MKITGGVKIKYEVIDDKNTKGIAKRIARKDNLSDLDLLKGVYSEISGVADLFRDNKWDELNVAHFLMGNTAVTVTTNSKLKTYTKLLSHGDRPFTDKYWVKPQYAKAITKFLQSGVWFGCLSESKYFHPNKTHDKINYMLDKIKPQTKPINADTTSRDSSDTQAPSSKESGNKEKPQTEPINYDTTSRDSSGTQAPSSKDNSGSRSVSYESLITESSSSTDEDLYCEGEPRGRNTSSSNTQRRSRSRSVSYRNLSTERSSSTDEDLGGIKFRTENIKLCDLDTLMNNQNALATIINNLGQCGYLQGNIAYFLSGKSGIKENMKDNRLKKILSESPICIMKDNEYYIDSDSRVAEVIKGLLSIGSYESNDKTVKKMAYFEQWLNNLNGVVDQPFPHQDDSKQLFAPNEHDKKDVFSDLNQISDEIIRDAIKNLDPNMAFSVEYNNRTYDLQQPKKPLTSDKPINIDRFFDGWLTVNPAFCGVLDGATKDKVKIMLKIAICESIQKSILNTYKLADARENQHNKVLDFAQGYPNHIKIDLKYNTIVYPELKLRYHEQRIDGLIDSSLFQDYNIGTAVFKVDTITDLNSDCLIKNIFQDFSVVSLDFDSSRVNLRSISRSFFEVDYITKSNIVSSLIRMHEKIVKFEHQVSKKGLLELYKDLFYIQSCNELFKQLSQSDLDISKRLLVELLKTLQLKHDNFNPINEMEEAKKILDALSVSFNQGDTHLCVSALQADPSNWNFNILNEVWVTRRESHWGRKQGVKANMSASVISEKIDTHIFGDAPACLLLNPEHMVVLNALPEDGMTGNMEALPKKDDSTKNFVIEEGEDGKAVYRGLKGEAIRDMGFITKKEFDEVNKKSTAKLEVEPYVENNQLYKLVNTKQILERLVQYICNTPRSLTAIGVHNEVTFTIKRSSPTMDAIVGLCVNGVNFPDDIQTEERVVEYLNKNNQTLLPNLKKLSAEINKPIVVVLKPKSSEKKSKLLVMNK